MLKMLKKIENAERANELFEQNRASIEADCRFYVSSFCRSSGVDSETAFAETLLYVWQYLGNYDESKGSLRTFVSSYAKNCLKLMSTKEYVYNEKHVELTNQSSIQDERLSMEKIEQAVLIADFARTGSGRQYDFLRKLLAGVTLAEFRQAGIQRRTYYRYTAHLKNDFVQFSAVRHAA